MTDLKIQSAFNFVDPDALIREATKTHINRKTNTVANSIEHSMIHTPQPNATVHHVVTAASPHPSRDRADNGDYYMIAYISMPLEWAAALTPERQDRWDVTFIGPAGRVHLLPPALSTINDLIGDRLYVGFDWLWILKQGQDGIKDPKQPTVPKIKDKLIEFATEIRDAVGATI